jgi:uncharacterized protein YndB with AHSA1/START domain
MRDIVEHINTVHRELGSRRIPAGEGQAVRLQRRYDASIDDVWDACTNAERIRRWFMPVSGDLRLGGTYQLEGNAGGQILLCEPPRLLKVTWVYGEDPKEADVSEVELRLSAAAESATMLELEHAAVTDPKMWAQYGPGAVGVGWDGALLSLSLHLQGEAIEDPETWAHTAEAKAFNTRSSEAWGAAFQAAGASAEEAATAVANTIAFYVPDGEERG